MNVVAIIPARMASSRFPGKHLSPLAGKPMILHVYERCGVDDVIRVVATTSDPTDNCLAGYLESRGLKVFRGSSSNPLERMYRAAILQEADLIVRITGDTPLVDSRTIERFVTIMRDTEAFDYMGVTNSPDGSDVEVFTMDALRKAYIHADVSETEHTTTWIRKNMRCESVESDPKYSGVHYSVNTVSDLKTCERLLERCGEGARYQEYANAYMELFG